MSAEKAVATWFVAVIAFFALFLVVIVWDDHDKRRCRQEAYAECMKGGTSDCAMASRAVCGDRQ